MWRHVFILAGVLGMGRAVAQDIIVNKAGDTLHCKIDLVREDRIHYTMIIDGRNKHPVIMKVDVRYYHQQGYAPVVLGTPTTLAPYVKPSKDPVVDPYRIALNAGWTYMTAPMQDVPEEWLSYYEGLRWGGRYGAEISRFFGSTFGASLLFDMARWKNSGSGMPLSNGQGGVLVVSVEEKITIGTIGPAITWRFGSRGSSGRWVGDLGVNYTWYVDQLAMEQYVFIVRAADICLRADLGYEFELSENLWFGLNAGFIASQESNFELDVGTSTTPIHSPEGEATSLSRINLGGGIRFVF